MTEKDFLNTDFNQVQSPAFVVYEKALTENMAVMQRVIDATDCRILLALKCFSMFHTFPLLKQTLNGVCASGPHEARLGREEFGGEVHTFATAFSESDIRDCAAHSDHITFNSFSQFQRWSSLAKELNPDIELGLRCNPEHSENETAIYDPCAAGSRLGITRDQFPQSHLEGISGLHFHTLCEMGADALERTLKSFEEKFGEFLPGMQWVNFGGGHHITASDYDINHLIGIINAFKSRYPHLTIYLEPGEAHALNAGLLVAEVLDITRNGDTVNAILNTSATCHMPDVIEMPYRPHIINSGEAGEKQFTYRLGGLSCLAGDIIGDYSFDHKLQLGDRLLFTDMAIYSMVKTNTFNGIKLPNTYYCKTDGKIELVRSFSYEDFTSRL